MRSTFRYSILLSCALLPAGCHLVAGYQDRRDPDASIPPDKSIRDRANKEFLAPDDVRRDLPPPADSLPDQRPVDLPRHDLPAPDLVHNVPDGLGSCVPPCVATHAGTGTKGRANGPALQAWFNDPFSIVQNAAGSLYVADRAGHRVRHIKWDGSQWQVSTLAGLSSGGYQEGDSSQAKFYYPEGLAVDPKSGQVYVADSENHRIRRIYVSAGKVMVDTYAGPQGPVPTSLGRKDGALSNARFNTPSDLAMDASGAMYVADLGNHCIRKISGGVVSTVAGDAVYGASGYLDGPVTIALLNMPSGVAVDSAGTTVYVADFKNNRIRKVTGGVVYTVAGDGQAGVLDGPVAAARFDHPRDVALDAADVLYVADQQNHRIRRIAGGKVFSLTGSGLGAGAAAKGIANGAASTARMTNPSGLVVDPKGWVFVADATNNLIRVVIP